MKLPADLFETLGDTVLAKAESQGYRVLALAIDAHHVHALAELPSSRKATKQIVGAWKQRASHAVRDQLPGGVWSKSCDPVTIVDEEHHRCVYQYILAHAHQGAWVWSYRDDSVEG